MHDLTWPHPRPRHQSQSSILPQSILGDTPTPSISVPLVTVLQRQLPPACKLVDSPLLSSLPFKFRAFPSGYKSRKHLFFSDFVCMYSYKRPLFATGWRGQVDVLFECVCVNRLIYSRCLIIGQIRFEYPIQIHSGNALVSNSCVYTRLSNLFICFSVLSSYPLHQYEWNSNFFAFMYAVCGMLLLTWHRTQNWRR